jgi:hypothetical protein
MQQATTTLIDSLFKKGIVLTDDLARFDFPPPTHIQESRGSVKLLRHVRQMTDKIWVSMGVGIHTKGVLNLYLEDVVCFTK